MVPPQNHWTPLFAAARYGHAEAASLLLSAGANPHTPSQGIVVQWTEMGPLVQQVREGKGNDTVFKTAYQLLARLHYTRRRETNRCDGPAAANINVKTALVSCAIEKLVPLANMNVNPFSLPCQCQPQFLAMPTLPVQDGCSPMAAARLHGHMEVAGMLSRMGCT